MLWRAHSKGEEQKVLAISPNCDIVRPCTLILDHGDIYSCKNIPVEWNAQGMCDYSKGTYGYAAFEHENYCLIPNGIVILLSINENLLVVKVDVRREMTIRLRYCALDVTGGGGKKPPLICVNSITARYPTLMEACEAADPYTNYSALDNIRCVFNIFNSPAVRDSIREFAATKLGRYLRDTTDALNKRAKPGSSSEDSDSDASSQVGM